VSFVGNLKAALDPLFDGRVYRDQAPDGTPFPYCTLFDDILRLPAFSGDRRTIARRRRAQVSIWQTMTAEDDAFVAQVEAACEAAEEDAPRSRPVVTYSRRLPYDPAYPNVSHRVMWVEVAERMPVP